MIVSPYHQFFIDYHSVMTVLFVFLNTSSYPFIYGPNNDRGIPYIKIGTPFAKQKKRAGNFCIYAIYQSLIQCDPFLHSFFRNPFSPHNNVCGTPGACLQGVFYCVQVTLSPQNLTPLTVGKKQSKRTVSRFLQPRSEHHGSFSRINYIL